METQTGTSTIQPFTAPAESTIPVEPSASDWPLRILVPHHQKKLLAGIGAMRPPRNPRMEPSTISEGLDEREFNSGSIIKGVNRESTVPETVRGDSDSGEMAK
jgi:hypothetical protein